MLRLQESSHISAPSPPLSLCSSRRFTNKQMLRLQESPEDIPEGETPHAVSVCVFDTLVDYARPGDRVEVRGGG